jgi:hypothetical protein
MVWVELREVEAVDSNIISDIQPKKGIIKKKRETLSSEERQLIISGRIIRKKEIH